MRPLCRRFCLAAAIAVVACQSPTDAGGHQSAPLAALPRALTIAEQQALAGTTTFGLALFRQVNAAHRGENVFVSPLSASLALGMALTGASGATLDSMRETLGWGARPMAEINAAYKGLADLLIALDPAVSFLSANSIWARQGLPVLQPFTAANQQTFAATTRLLDFASAAAAPTINTWVSEATNGRITSIVSAPIDPAMVMFLINAIWFKGSWRDQFKVTDTRAAPFMNAAGDTSSVPMMTRTGRVRFVGGTLAHGADLPYGNGAFSMVILLPRFGQTVEQLVDSLTGATWQAAIADAATSVAANGMVSLPKFTLSFDARLNAPLQALGMGIAFSDLADFSRMTPVSVAISEVRQKTWVQVNEEGTEAAAVTSIGIGITSGPPSLRVDRPFVFAIRERFSGALLFVGKVARLPAS